MTIQTDLLPKINNEDYQRLILKHSVEFSEGEIRLLNEILEKFTFDVVQAQALAQAVVQQGRFGPHAPPGPRRGGAGGDGEVVLLAFGIGKAQIYEAGFAFFNQFYCVFDRHFRLLNGK